jgi:hypothetical protein
VSTHGSDQRNDSQEGGSTTARRIERRKRGLHTPWTTRMPWTTPSADEVAAMPVGTRRAVALAPGLHATLIKTGPDAWQLSRRYGFPDELLTLIPTARRVRKEDGPTAGRRPKGTSFADAVARMLTDTART